MSETDGLRCHGCGRPLSEVEYRSQQRRLIRAGVSETALRMVGPRCGPCVGILLKKAMKR